MKKPNPLPCSVMVWSVHDPVIEDRHVLESQFQDLLAKEFDGVAVWVRCSRYNWSHPDAVAALQHISTLCRQNGIACWLGPDPRFISRELIQGDQGVPIVLYGDDVRASKVPNLSPVVDGKFNIRCTIPPRHTHMLQEVAIEFYPVGVLKAYAIKAGQTQFDEKDVIDITEQTHFFYHAKEHYIEAFGRFAPPDVEAWQVVAFFQVHSSHVDFSSEAQLQRYLAMLKALSEQVSAVDMIMFDEPGYTSVYGALPFSTIIQNRFHQKTGLQLSRQLWKFAVASADASHVPVRINYFKTVQETMVDFQKKTLDAAKKYWSDDMLFGIHDTWHFESADMADMNHGSMDLWKSLPTKSYGFVDFGGIDKLRRPDCDHYANFAALGIICKSLGKFAEKAVCYNNLWTIGDDDGEGWQAGVMDYCVNNLAVLGQRWMPHAYGPVGTIGEENTFLGSPPLPGYPNHSTWEHYPAWNRRLKEHFSTAGEHLPWANILLVYPIEHLFSEPDARANECAKNVFKILLALHDHHFHVDVVSPEMLLGGQWQDGTFQLNQYQYERIICPYPNFIDDIIAGVLRAGRQNVFRIFAATENMKPADSMAMQCMQDIAKLIDFLKRQNLRPVVAPPHCWVSLTVQDAQSIISVAPSRYTFTYEGDLGYKTHSATLSRSSGLTRIAFANQ